MSVVRTRWNNVPLRAKVLATMSVPLLALIAAATAFLIVGRSANAAQDAVVEALRVRQAAQEVDSAMQSLDTAMWGSALMGRPLAGQDDAGRAAVRRAVEDLRRLVADDPAQLAHLAGFEDKVSARTDVMVRMVGQILEEIRRTGELPDLTDFFASSAAAMTPTMSLAKVQQAAEDTVEARTLQARRARDRVQITVLAGAGIGAVGGILLVFVITGGLVRRLRGVERNARLLAEGNALEPLEESGDEIGQLAHELTQAADLLSMREREMLAAKDDAERSNQAKTEFLSRMSHELRTPLNSVLGFAQLITMGEPRREDRESADQIVRAGRHLLGLIDEVLDISRIEGGRFRLSMESVRLADSVEEAIDLVQPLAQRSRVALYTEIDAELWAHADRQRLSQVVLNLLSNAIKFNRVDGEVRVRVAADGDTTRIAIADTGRGIDPSDIERLFVPFERLDADELGVEGTGLGLALSRRLAEAMGGGIDVTSERGSGTTFTIRLRRAAAIDAIAADPAPSRDRRGGASGSEPLVLYVEDNLANLRLVERILGHIGPTRLITAVQGSLGIELARQQKPDLILLDLHLPDIHGLEVLKRLKADAATCDVPIVVITADATAETRTRALADGAHECITKPVDMIPFIETIETVLSRAREVA